MGSYNWVLFAIDGIFIISIAVLLLQKGFWAGLTGACAIFTALAFALRYDAIAAPFWSFAQGADTFIYLLIILLVGSLIFGALANNGVKLHAYFNKLNKKGTKSKKGEKADLIAGILLILMVIIVSVFLISWVGKIGESKNVEGFSAAIKGFSEKLDAISKSSSKWLFYPVQVSLALFLWLWGTTGAWVGKDSSSNESVASPVVWKVIFALIGPLGIAIGIFLPIPFVDALIPMIFYIVPALIYAHIRNVGLPYDDQVLTKKHIGKLLKNIIKTKKKKAEVVYATIELFGYGKELAKSDVKARTEAVRALQGYDLFAELVENALKRKSTSLQYGNMNGNLEVKLFIDGFWFPKNDIHSKPMTEESFDLIYAAMRAIIGANPEDKQSRQSGMFYIEYDKKQGAKKKMLARMMIQGNGKNQGVLIQFERPAVRFGSFAKMKLSEQRASQIKGLLKTEKGLIVLAAPPGQGLRTFTDVTLSETDRFTRDYSTVEDVRHPYNFIENIILNTYDSAKGETPMTILPEIFFKEPKGLVIRDLVNKETFQLCCEEIENERLIITTTRAKTSAQAIMNLVRTGIDRKLLANSLTAVITQHLVRTLCSHCKEEFTPDEETLKRLRIPAGKVNVLYRKRTHIPEPSKKDENGPCDACMDIGYKGRIGLYDVIVVNDEIRQIIATNPSEAALQRAALKTGGGSFMADGIRLVATGLTSYDELVRALKE